MTVPVLAEKPGTLPETNEYRFKVAAASDPGYKSWTVRLIGWMIGYARMFSSGMTSSSSELTIAFSTMSCPRMPLTFNDATASGASSALFSESALIGRYGGCSVQSEFTTFSRRSTCAWSKAFLVSPAALRARRSGKNTSVT